MLQLTVFLWKVGKQTPGQDHIQGKGGSLIPIQYPQLPVKAPFLSPSGVSSEHACSSQPHACQRASPCSCLLGTVSLPSASLTWTLFPQPPSSCVRLWPLSATLCLFPYFLLCQIEVPLILASLGGVTGLDLTLSECPSCPGDLWVET